MADDRSAADDESRMPSNDSYTTAASVAPGEGASLDSANSRSLENTDLDNASPSQNDETAAAASSTTESEPTRMPSNEDASADEIPQGGLDKDGYPEQRHAGKLGLGPNYHSGPTLSDKVTGLKEQVKGKVLKKPDLVQQGKERQTGVLAEKEAAEDDAQDPFATDDSTNSPAKTSSVAKDAAAEEGNTETVPVPSDE